MLLSVRLVCPCGRLTAAHLADSMRWTLEGFFQQAACIISGMTTSWKRAKEVVILLVWWARIGTWLAFGVWSRAFNASPLIFGVLEACREGLPIASVEVMLSSSVVVKSNYSLVSCSRTQVLQPGFEPTLCWTETPELEFGALIRSSGPSSRKDYRWP